MIIPILFHLSAYADDEDDDVPEAESREETATVVFKSGDKPMTVSQVDGTAHARTSGGYSVSVDVTHDVCETPCKAKFTPGLHKFGFSGPGLVGIGGQYRLRDGVNKLIVTPKSSAMQVAGYTLGVAGLCTVGLGVLFALQDEPNGNPEFGTPPKATAQPGVYVPVIATGVVLAGGGGVLFLASIPKITFKPPASDDD